MTPFCMTHSGSPAHNLKEQKTSVLSLLSCLAISLNPWAEQLESGIPQQPLTHPTPPATVSHLGRMSPT